MSLQRALDVFIDKTTGSIKRISKEYPVSSKEDFLDILRAFKMFNSNKSDISIGNSAVGVTPWLWLKLGSNYYHLNSDTKIEGVNMFLSNKSNDWRLIANQKNYVKNKITNRPDLGDIPGFYLYKIL